MHLIPCFIRFVCYVWRLCPKRNSGPHLVDDVVGHIDSSRNSTPHPIPNPQTSHHVAKPTAFLHITSSCLGALHLPSHPIPLLFLLHFSFPHSANATPLPSIPTPHSFGYVSARKEGEHGTGPSLRFCRANIHVNATGREKAVGMLVKGGGVGGVCWMWCGAGCGRDNVAGSNVVEEEKRGIQQEGVSMGGL
jgi:hypothetical protein